MDAVTPDKMSFDNKRLGFQPVSADDREFLLEVYASSREIELSAAPWNETQKKEFVEHQLAAQTAYYSEKFAGATHDLILLDGVPVGRLYVDRTQHLISILDITVLTRWRRRGIGTIVIASLQKEAGETGRRVGVYVENFNPSQMLFRKLGFTVIREDEMNLYLEWSGTSG
jgi:ribosomal protein S18 acetylase RimI-like enzyme